MSAFTQVLNRPTPSTDHNLRLFDASARPSKTYLWVLRGLCGAALCITGYLAYVAFNAGEVAGCEAGKLWNCSHVLHSRWSKVGGVSVSIPAFLMYALLAVALSVCKPANTGNRRGMAWGLVTICSLAAGLAAIWFVSLQIFAIGHLCPYCIAAHACGIALATAVLWKRPLGTRMTSQLATLSILGVGLLIGGQLMIAPPPTYKIERFADEAVAPAEEELMETIPVAAGSTTSTASQNVEVFEPF